MFVFNALYSNFTEGLNPALKDPEESVYETTFLILLISWKFWSDFNVCFDLIFHLFENVLSKDDR